MNIKIFKLCGVIFLIVLVNFVFVSAKRKYTDEDLDSWDAPAEIKRRFPFYLTGVDYDGLPVFVFEFGKWDVRKLVEEGSDEDRTNLDKYIEQTFYTFVKTAREFSNETDGGYAGIVDMEGYDIRQIAHVPTITYIHRVFSLRFASDFAENLEWALAINVNFVAERLTELMRPILGAILDKAEVLGTNKAKWLPKILRKVPPESLPPWYGGPAKFKPLAVYG